MDRKLHEDAYHNQHSLSMLQKIAGALNQKVKIKFLAIAAWNEFGVDVVLHFIHS